MKWDQKLTEAMFALRLPHAVPMQQVVPGRPLELRPGVPQVELPTVRKKQMGRMAQISGKQFPCMPTDNVRRTGVGVME